MNSKERKQNFSGFSVRLTRDSRLFEDDGGFLVKVWFPGWRQEHCRACGTGFAD
jgi:CO dehydrogenase/acetyl-CoA synthase beta subunit